jgi:hypothetical protein
MKTNYKMMTTALAGIALGALAMMVAGIATALAQDTVRVRGTIERIDGSIYVIKARDGAELKVMLADNPQIAGVVKASLSDIKQGSFVGVTAMPRADGSQNSKYTSFPSQCAKPEKDITHGTFDPRAQ